MDDFEKELLSSIRSSASQHEDEHHYFGMQIANQLRGLDPMLAMLAKTRINQTLFDLMYPNASVHVVDEFNQ